MGKFRWGKIIWYLLIYSTFLSGLLISGCSGSKSASYSPSNYTESTSIIKSRAEAEPLPLPVDKSLDKKNVQKSEKRKVHYNGYIKLRVTKPSLIMKKITDLVIASGGYVELIRGRTATYNVPVDKFTTVFKKVTSLGEVLQKSITAHDISDYFRDTKLRLKIYKMSRKRYLEILKKVTDEKEKIKILKEIQRLNEKIETLTSQLKLLETLASFSKLNVKLEPRQNLSARGNKNEVAEFKWIHRLSPFSRSEASRGKPVKFYVPEGMVELKKNQFWMAESADGTVFWSYKRNNKPKGSQDFWIEAIKVRIEEEFSGVEIFKEGKYKIIKLKSSSEKPYIYMIGVNVEDSELRIFEIYFPTRKQEKRYINEILSKISKGIR